MGEWQIAFAVSGGLLTLMGFSFGVFWNIIQSTKNDINKRIETIFDERNTIMTQLNMKFSSLEKDVSDRTPYSFSDNTYQRKDTHSIEYTQVVKSLALLEIAMSEMKTKIDKLILKINE